jgi:hypothetical protein
MKTSPKILTKEDLFNIYSNLNAYCGKQIIKGKMDYVKEAFELHKTELQKNSYDVKHGRALSTVNYHNILQLSLYLKEFEWTQKFIREYTCKVIDYEQENMLNFGYACLNFEMGSYDKVLEYASKIKPEHFFLKYEIKGIMLRTYYELNQVESVLSLIDTSKHFLYKNRSVSDERKVPFGNFLKFLSELVKIKDEKNSRKIENVKNEILNEKILFKKKWLIEKIQELNNV